MANSYSRISSTGDTFKQLKWGSITLVFICFLVVVTHTYALTMLAVFSFLAITVLPSVLLPGFAKRKLEDILKQRQYSLESTSNRPQISIAPPINTSTIDNHGPSLSVMSRDYNNTLVFESGVFTDYIQNVYTLGMTTDKYGRPVPPAYYELYCVLSIKLKSLAPHIFFDSQNTKGQQAKLFFEKNQEYTFEGDFNTHFNSYVAPGQSLDSLAVITPDVMQALINAQGYDIELIGDRVQIYAPFTKNAAEQFADMKQKGELIASELNSNIVNFDIQPSATTLSVRAASRIVNNNHVKLWVTAFVSALLYTLFLISVTKYEGRSTSDVIGIIVIDTCLVLLVIFLGYTVYRKNKNKDDKIDQNRDLGQ